MNHDNTTVRKLYYGDSLVNIAVANDETQIPSAITSWSVDEWGKPVEIVVKNGQTTIPSNWQYNNVSLTSCTLPNTITSIGSYAFCGAGNNMIINIPASVTNVNGNAFSNSSINNDLTIPYNSLSAATSGFSSTWYYGFASSDLNNHTVTIENNTTVIPRYMFYNSINATIIVPSSVTYLSSECFAVYTNGSKTVRFLGNVPPDAASYVYNNSNCPFYAYNKSYLDNLTIIVPKYYVSNYKNKFGTDIGARVQGI